MRLQPRATLTLGRHSPSQEHMFHWGNGVGKRHLTISHTGDALLLQDLNELGGTRVKVLAKKKKRHPLTRQRINNLVSLRQILGLAKNALPQEEALALIRQVNTMEWSAKLRPRDDRGLPGGLLRIPDHVTPIILGDLHANLNNLLTALSVNGFLSALQEGSACLILLGDSVHCELGYCLAEMDSSMVMMDTIFRLMTLFPQRVFYLMGNHDSFGKDVFKGGVPQGELWRDHLLDVRGQAYVEEMSQFYQSLPVVAVGKDFLACHASPPNAPVSEEMIVNLYKYVGLSRVLTWNRLRSTRHPGGYVGWDVKHFRETFRLPVDTPFIVAHTPLNREGTLWTHVSGISNHHIVYSGRAHQLSLFTRVGGQVVPLVYFSDGIQEVLAEMDMLEMMANHEVNE
ncbi:MAG: metallophosphoesterase [Magnetococcales bacterium]|nr:metallophosphoesterase [Magnetococcales bacterium]NGZ27020.1 metallophosphoesterase [Magnetococcales bacterium]